MSTITERMQGLLAEADEITYHELLPSHQNYVDRVEKALGTKLSTAWSGIHGTILEFHLERGVMLNLRIPKRELDVITSIPSMRWLEVDKDGITVGC